MLKFTKKRVVSLVLVVAMLLGSIPADTFKLFSWAADVQTDETSVIGKFVQVTTSFGEARKEIEYPGQTVTYRDYPELLIIRDVVFVGKDTWYQLDAAAGYFWPEGSNSDVDDGWYLQSTKVKFVEPKNTVVDAEGKPASSVQMGKYEKPVLTAKSPLEGEQITYQWQIEYAADKWVNIYGANGTTIKLSYGMVASLMDADGKVNVRIKSSNGTMDAYSAAIPVQVTNSAAAASAYSMANPSVANNGVMTAAEGDVQELNLTVKFYLKDGTEEIYQRVIAEFVPGETREVTINVPQRAGYKAYWCDGENVTEITGATYKKTFTLTEDATYEVRYVPQMVEYYVVHYKQNVSGEGYTQYGETETKEGLTDSEVPDVHKTIEGFYNLPYIHATIAPDGSTVINVYYDRYYYLMTFDLGEGGYGVDPAYALYETTITVGKPTRPGYVFEGWTDWNGTNIETNADDQYSFTVPAKHANVTARWTAGNANYTIVYWKENAMPEKDANGNVIRDSNGDPVYGYSYWAQSKPISVKVGTVVSGSNTITDNSIPKVKNVTDATYFTYNDARTDKNVAVKGDDTTVVNVYYTRNSYTLYFYATGDCGIPLHTHNDGTCDSYLICGKNEHEHSAACGERTLSCGIDDHPVHTDACLTCSGLHPTHTAECLTCTKTSHTHTRACYGISNNATAWDDTDAFYENNHRINGSEINGNIGAEQKRNSVFSSWTNTGNKYIYFDGEWYLYKGDVAAGNQVSSSCGLQEGVHTHNDAEGCYKDVIHAAHTDACYDHALHTHSDACYTYPDCNAAAEHEHTDACYSACTKVVHASHTGCPTSNSRHVVKVITAKYEADISGEWPVRGDACLSKQNSFYGWQKSGVNTTMVSKRPVMTSDLCNTSATSNVMTINVATSNYTSDVDLNVWFESVDQSNTQTSDTRKLHTNGKYYDLSPVYSQPLKRASGDFSAKEIMGMKAGSVISGKESGDVTIHYDRLRYTVTFYNADKTTVATYDSVMYEYPVKNLTYTDKGVTKSVSTLVPAYPNDFEPNAYEFKGWYTTPECFPGSEFNFETGVVPNDNLNLYAKWAPVTRTVNVYFDESLGQEIGETQTIPHGSTASKVATPVHPEGLEFVTWMYKTIENGVEVEKPFSFDMQIKQDIEVYAVWRATAIINYEIHYVGIDGSGNKFDLAAPTKGQQIWGKTETFKPKGTDLYYSQYQDDGYFAMTPDHSIVMGKVCSENNSDCTWDPVTKTHTFTFYYELGPVVPYEVHYYYAGTTTPVFLDSDGNEIVGGDPDNRKSVVIETPLMKVGYAVDAPQKSLVVIKGEENKIIFYYTEDKNVSYYTVNHYLIHKDGTVTTYQSIPYNANVGDGISDQSANVAWLNIPGFAADKDNPNNLRSGKVTEDPILELKMYYTENDATLNYQVVGGVGGTVSIDKETLGVMFGQASGSIATALPGYKFVGWYSHWDCLESQWLSGDAEYVPNKADTALWVDGTIYYAKFEYDLTSLTIVKNGAEDWKDIDLNQTFIFNISGNDLNLDVTVHRDDEGNWKTKIDGLTVGKTYTITEKTDWSWRYQCTGWNHTNGGSGKTNVATITLGLDGTITFTNTRPNEQWLDGDSWCDNLFN